MFYPRRPPYKKEIPPSLGQARCPRSLAAPRIPSRAGHAEVLQSSVKDGWNTPNKDE